MGHHKLERFEAIKGFPNVLQYPADMPDKWKELYGNDNPLTLELACGKGEYSTGLGAQYPDRNFLGVDVKGNRIYIGAKKALAEGLRNVAFLRTQIGKLADYFHPHSIADIWIVFPDPFLKDGKAKNRLTHPRFLSIYQGLLRPGGIIHLKTDSPPLYEFTLETIREQGCEIVENLQDIHGNGTANGPLAIRTFYEGMHLADNRKIFYLSFRLPGKPIVIPGKKEKVEAGQ